MSQFIFEIISTINNYINSYYFFSYIIYFLFALFFFIFSLPGGTIVVLASGFFFGFISGFIINIIAISFGSFIFIIFSKTLFQSLFSKYYLKYSDRITSYINNSSYEYLILLRLLIGPPLIFQNICISLLNLSNKKILISTIVGFTPLMLIFSYVGSYASNVIEIQEITLSKIISPEILFILLILILFILVKIFVKK